MIFKQYTLNGKRRVSNGKRHVIQRKQTRENVCGLCLNANSCRAARIVMQASYNTSAGALFDVLHWDNLSLRRKKSKANLIFKILDGKAPTYLQDLFSVRGTGYNIRNSEMRLNVPRPRTDYMKKSFCYSGAVLFNSLPQNIRKCQSLPQFRKAINKYYNDNLI